MATAICHELSDEWKVERANGLGGSDAPQILGLSPFGGPAAVAASKLGYYAADIESELAEWGHYVEEPLIRRFGAETGIQGKLSGILYRSDDDATPWLQATLDGFIEGENAGIQCKLAVFSWDSWDEGVPDYVEAQVQHEMAVTGWDAVYVLALLRGYQFRWARVDRDERFIAETLVPTLGEFWRKLKADEPIAPLGAPDREWEALKARYARPVSGKVVELRGAEWVAEFDRWRSLSDAKSAAEKAAKESRNRIVAAIGDGEVGVFDDGRRVSLKRQTRKSYVVEESTFPVLREAKR